MGLIFDRLMGLETEYGILFHGGEDTTRTPTKLALYNSLIRVLRHRVLAVDAKHFKEGVFTANGGAVWFEATAGGGLVEGATPECRGPRQLMEYQRAQDSLLAECAGEAVPLGQFRLIKNDRDSQGNIYGAQENYEVNLAQGFWLAAWRIGLLLLLPLVLLTWLGFLVLLLGLGVYFVAAGAVCFLCRPLLRDRDRLAWLLFGRDEAGEASLAPGWLEASLMWMTRLLTTPLALSLYLLLRITAFRKIRRHLLALLVSRSLVSGSGMLDDRGRFHLADKAPAMNCIFGFGGFLNDRPVFIGGHFLKTLCLQAWFSPREFLDLFQRRQRLQIGLGDSNMAEVSEFLRIGTTLLVIDAIEAGYLTSTPRVLRPVRAIRRLCADPSLTAVVGLAPGGQMTGLEIQRYYFAQCQRFVASQSDAPSEALEVLRVWEETLDALDDDRHSLIGSLDWITKQHLICQAGSDATWEQRKKIDLRYHELSPDGYFEVLRAKGIVKMVVDQATLDRAMRSAPPETPATTRGHYIREFGDGQQALSVNWKTVTVGAGAGAKVIRLADYGRRPGPLDDRTGRSRAGVS